MAKVEIRLPSDLPEGWGGKAIEVVGAAQETTLKALALKMGVNFAEFNKNLSGLGDAVGDAGEQADTFGNSLRSLGQGIMQWGGMLTNSGTRLSDFGDAIEASTRDSNIAFQALGTTIRLLMDELTKQIAMFHELSGAGLQFSGSLVRYREMAITAGVGLNVFKDAVASSSDILALFGGSVTAGAKRFANISGIIQKEFGPAMNRLGIAFETQIEYLGDYLDIQTRMGRSQTMTDRQLADGTTNYILQLDQLATITGKHRKMISEQLKQDVSSKRLSGLFQALEAGANDNLKGVIGAIQGIEDADMQQGLKDLIATGGVPMTDFGKSLMLLNPALGAMAEQARNGEINASQFAQEIQRTAELAQARGKQDKWLASILDVQGNSILSATTQMARYTEFGTKFNETQLEQQKMVESNDKAMAGLNQSWQRLKNMLIDMLIPAIEKVSGWIDDMATGIEKLTRGEMPEFKSQLSALGIALGGIIVLYGSMKLAMIAFKGTLAAARMIGGGGGVGSMGMVGAMKTAGAAPLRVAAGGAAIGAGVGAGAALAGAGVGAGAWLAGKGLKSVGTGLQTFNDINADNMKKVASSIWDMTNAVTGMAVKGQFAILAKDMPKFAKGLKKGMKEIDTGAIVKYANAIDGLGDAFGNLKNNMGGAISASGKSTGDKIDTLNSTLMQILLELELNTRFAKITSGKDHTGNLQASIE